MWCAVHWRRVNMFIPCAASLIAMAVSCLSGVAPAVATTEAPTAASDAPSVADTSVAPSPTTASTPSPAEQVLITETASVSEEEAVLGGVARLPCDLRPPARGDEVALVIWYKGGAASPIYSLDARGRSLEQQPTHWADERTLGGRSFFRVEDKDEADDVDEDDENAPRGTHLAIESVRESDGGSYRCRVDFRRSPTRNAIVNLTVIVPPQKLTLLGGDGQTIEGDTLGPLPEGASAVVRCVAHGGRPAPHVSWWRDGAEAGADDAGAQPSALEPQSALRVGPLARADLGAQLQCRASNTHRMSPLTRTISIDLKLAPLWVRLVGANRPLSASIVQDVQCASAGGRPSPRLVWRLGAAVLHGAKQTVSEDGNVTTSTLPFAPSARDLGQELECSIEGVAAALRDAWRLDVTYVPEASVTLGANLNASSIREGDDVYFECNVQAHPWIHRVSWRHKGRPLHNNASAGVILTNQTLVLQSVRNESSGGYTCVATNAEGDGESDAFHLDVKYAPVCRAGQQRVYGAARGEQLQVSCEVDANPPATLFRWSFNSSAVAARAVPASAVAVAARGGGGGGGAAEGGGGDALLSTAAYAPRAEADYGTLLCWGRNALGAQRAPCVFHVVPAGRPEAPRGCALRNRTWSALQVACARGFDGGLPQRFTLEVFEGAGAAGAPGAAGRGRLVANVTAKAAPEFTVLGLEPGEEYVLHVYSTNGKGRSEDTFTLTASTLGVSALQPRRTATTAPTARGESSRPSSGLPGTPLLWALAGAGSALALAAVAAAAVAALRGRPRPRPRPCHCQCSCPCWGGVGARRGAAGDSPKADASLKSPALKHLALKGSVAAVLSGEQPRVAPGVAPALAPAGATLLAGTPVITDDPLDNPDVVPLSNEVDVPKGLFKPLDPTNGALSARPLALDPCARAPLYVGLHGFPRPCTPGSPGASEALAARKAAGSRDMATQAHAPSALHGCLTPLAMASPAQTPSSGLPPPTSQGAPLGVAQDAPQPYPHTHQRPPQLQLQAAWAAPPGPAGTLRLHAQTQTPSARHKESAV